MTKTVKIWKALLEGECKQIGLTEASVRDLAGNAWHTKKNHTSWRFTSEDIEVPVVTGKVVVFKCQTVDLDKPVAAQTSTAPITDAPHVMWTCPHCGEDHFADLESDTPMPDLWFCETSASDKMALVQWEQEQVAVNPGQED